MVLIRFNPDYCQERDKSCFDKECRLIKSEWKTRIKALKRAVTNALKEVPVELMTIVYLFFD
jgi:hypothetical protein